MPAPNLFLIGAARSGTTYVADALGGHPEVDVSHPKEPHHLAHADRPPFTGPGDALGINQVVVRARADYLDLWPRPTRYRCDASVSTLHHPDESIARMQALDLAGEPKLVVCLRHPARRAVSAYQYQRSKGYETLPLAEALAREPERIAAGYQHMWHYQAGSEYSRLLSPFLDTFGPGALHVVISERLGRDPDHELCRLGGFLGLGSVPLMGGEPSNQSGELRSPALKVPYELARRAARHPRVERHLSRPRREALKRLFVTSASVASLPAAVEARFDEEVAATEALLGEIPEWHG